MEPVFNQYEQHLDDITHANWETQYLSNEARLKERNPFLRYKVGGVKIGSLVGRICKLLHLNCFECVKKFFSCGDLQEASQIIKDTIRLINTRITPHTSVLPRKTKEVLFERTALVFNTLLDNVNSKRNDTEKLPISLRINLTELLADGRQDSTPAASPTSPALQPVTAPSETTAAENMEPAGAPKAKKKSGRRKVPQVSASTTRRSSRLAVKPPRA